MLFDPTVLPVFLTGALLLQISPGPDMAFVIATGFTQGRRAAAFGALGVSCSVFMHSLFAALGLSALFAASAVAFEIVRYVGIAYLLWLAYKSFRAGLPQTAGSTKTKSDRENFQRGFLSNLLNPKPIIFMSLFLIQLASPAFGSIFIQVVSLGALLALITFTFMASLAYAAGSVGRFMTSNQTYQAVLSKLMGVFFVGLAARLWFVKKPA